MSFNIASYIFFLVYNFVYSLKNQNPDKYESLSFRISSYTIIFLLDCLI